VLARLPTQLESLRDAVRPIEKRFESRLIQDKESAAIAFEGREFVGESDVARRAYVQAFARVATRHESVLRHAVGTQ
jgi:hypothetical protein